jgi:hypothetical protein
VIPADWRWGLDDAQVFSARAYERLVERCAAESWPAQPLALVFGGAVLAVLWRWPGAGARLVAAAAALAFAAPAVGWLPRCYADLHWAAGWLAAGFGLQALLLAAAAAWPPALARATAPRARAAAVLLGLWALLVVPLATALASAEGGWRDAEVAGLMPAPAVAAGFAVVPLAAPRWRLVLLPLPLAAAALEALTQAATGRATWPLLPLAAALLLGAVLAAGRG